MSERRSGVSTMGPLPPQSRGNPRVEGGGMADFLTSATAAERRQRPRRAIGGSSPGSEGGRDISNPGKRGIREALKKTPNSVATRFLRLLSGHAPTAKFLKERWGTSSDSNKCWWCDAGKIQTRHHFFVECERWKDEIKEMWRHRQGEGPERMAMAEPFAGGKAVGKVDKDGNVTMGPLLDSRKPKPPPEDADGSSEC